ncbi:elongation factor P hydroxylase [Ferrimonas gelatinilytica]|uniref:Elongation factor P hydroxylase n=1 Tax=Ferrimonas gelatinilytica TaxID=1255257 RepID=A0ABP9S505_9GAMM
MDNAQLLIKLFNHGLGQATQTRLLHGQDEPLYLPADQYCPYHRIYFAHGFVASALHELAHWCQAGPARRLQVDYGYWYEADGRTAQQQQRFEAHEAKPQAIEWYLSLAWGRTFDVSADNLSLETDRPAFRRAVQAAAQAYCHCGWPTRAVQLARDMACLGQGHIAEEQDFYWPEEKLCSNWD